MKYLIVDNSEYATDRNGELIIDKVTKKPIPILNARLIDTNKYWFELVDGKSYLRKR